MKYLMLLVVVFGIAACKTTDQQSKPYSSPTYNHGDYAKP